MTNSDSPAKTIFTVHEFEINVINFNHPECPWFPTIKDPSGRNEFPASVETRNNFLDTETPPGEKLTSLN